MSSEVGVLKIPPEQVRYKGRLQPGRMFLVDFEQGRIVADEELKQLVSQSRPYPDWLGRQRVALEELPKAAPPKPSQPEELLKKMQAFGYTVETMRPSSTRSSNWPHNVGKRRL